MSHNTLGSDHDILNDASIPNLSAITIQADDFPTRFILLLWLKSGRERGREREGGTTKRMNGPMRRRTYVLDLYQALVARSCGHHKYVVALSCLVQEWIGGHCGSTERERPLLEPAKIPAAPLSVPEGAVWCILKLIKKMVNSAEKNWEMKGVCYFHPSN